MQENVEEELIFWTERIVRKKLESLHNIIHDNNICYLLAFSELPELLVKRDNAEESFSILQQYILKELTSKKLCLLSLAQREELKKFSELSLTSSSLLLGFKLLITNFSMAEELPLSIKELIETKEFEQLRNFVAEALIPFENERLAEKLHKMEEKLSAGDEQNQLLFEQLNEANRKLLFSLDESLTKEILIDQLRIKLAEQEDQTAELHSIRIAEITTHLESQLNAKDKQLEQCEERIVELGAKVDTYRKLSAENEKKRKAIEERYEELMIKLEKDHVTLQDHIAQKTQLQEACEELNSLRNELTVSRIENDQNKKNFEVRLAENENIWKLKESQLVLQTDRALSEAVQWKKQVEEKQSMISPTRSTGDILPETLGLIENINILDESVDISTLANCRQCLVFESELTHYKSLFTKTEMLLETTNEELTKMKNEVTDLHESNLELKAQAKTAGEESIQRISRDRSYVNLARSELSRKSFSDLNLSSDLVAKMMALESENKKLRTKTRLLSKEIEEREDYEGEKLEIVYSICKELFEKDKGDSR